ncbi:hypothetical protein SMMN14_08003 [Sphaerulina musiva]
MLTSTFIAVGAAVLASFVSAQDDNHYTGEDQCSQNTLSACLSKSASGCLKIARSGQLCVEKTQNCDDTCSEVGPNMYAYIKWGSPDDTCICSTKDASKYIGQPATPNPPRIITGGKCNFRGLATCHGQKAFGCVQTEDAQLCVNQTKYCDAPCLLLGGGIYAYQKANSKDLSCVCTSEDAGVGRGIDKRTAFVA